MTQSKGFIYNVPHSVRPHTARKTYWLQLSEINPRVSLETNTNVLKTTLAGLSVITTAFSQIATGKVAQEMNQKRFREERNGRAQQIRRQSRSTEQDRVMAKSAEPGREKMGRREWVWKGMQVWIAPPRNVRLYNFRTSDPSDQ